MDLDLARLCSCDDDSWIALQGICTQVALERERPSSTSMERRHRWDLLLLAVAAFVATGDCILCYQSSCRSDNNTLCVFDKSTSDLVECHFDEMLETLVLVQVGILTPNQTYTNVKDADMWCMHAKATAMWKDGQRQVDYRSCVPPDPLRCEILRNSTQAKYEKLHGRHARVYWDCAMCNTKGCNSADTSGDTPVVLQAVVMLALWVGTPVI
uniref:Protein quiver n=1 Tax=Timema monikensis TaxID=170555 RepID=A0A7R9HTE4_9NEOP|nr:unnamed protein product [Timema monikensis]